MEHPKVTVKFEPEEKFEPKIKKRHKLTPLTQMLLVAAVIGMEPHLDIDKILDE